MMIMHDEKLALTAAACLHRNANAPDYDASWLRWDFQRRLLLGHSNWRYSAPEGPPSALRRMLATAYGVNIWYNLQQGAAERPTAWLFARAQRRRAARGEEPLDASSRRGAGLATEIKMRLFSAVGLCAVYLIWAVMAWIIFTYGSLVYRLMGDAAQAKFAHGWGVGLAISQATQCKDMLIVALQSAAVLTVLETLWLVGNRPWFEETLGARASSRGGSHDYPLASPAPCGASCRSRPRCALCALSTHRFCVRAGVHAGRAWHPVRAAHAHACCVLLNDRLMGAGADTRARACVRNTHALLFCGILRGRGAFACRALTPPLSVIEKFHIVAPRSFALLLLRALPAARPMARRSASWHRALEAAIDTLETRSGCEWLAFDNSRLTNVPPAELTAECLLKKANHLLLPPEARAHALLPRLAKRARGARRAAARHAHHAP
jgi:hypothetical protein